MLPYFSDLHWRARWEMISRHCLSMHLSNYEKVWLSVLRTVLYIFLWIFCSYIFPFFCRNISLSSFNTSELCIHLDYYSFVREACCKYFISVCQLPFDLVMMCLPYIKTILCSHIDHCFLSLPLEIWVTVTKPFPTLRLKQSRAIFS